MTDKAKRQANLDYAVRMVAPKPLFLYKNLYEILERDGLNMSGCEVIKDIPEWGDRE
jgi:hypothetical protein